VGEVQIAVEHDGFVRHVDHELVENAGVDLPARMVGAAAVKEDLEARNADR